MSEHEPHEIHELHDIENIVPETKPLSINISSAHLGFLGAFLIILGFGWNFVVSPIQSLATDVHDIKTNYVSRESLSRELERLATKSDLATVSAQVEVLKDASARLQVQVGNLTDRAQEKRR